MRTRAFRLRAMLQAGLVVAVALVALSCGGGAGPESLTGPPETAAASVVEEGSGLVSTSEATERVPVCHFDAVTGIYSELGVPSRALAPHLGHGDFEKPDAEYDCAEGPPLPSCRCFSAESIDLAASRCEGQPSCAPGAGFRFQWLCPTGEFAVQVSASDFERYSCSSLETGLILLDSEEEYQACLGEMRASQVINDSCSNQPAV